MNYVEGGPSGKLERMIGEPREYGMSPPREILAWMGRARLRAAAGEPGNSGTYQRLCWVLHGASQERCEKLRDALGLDCGTAVRDISHEAMDRGKLAEALDLLGDLEAELIERREGGKP